MFEDFKKKESGKNFWVDLQTKIYGIKLFLTFGCQFLDWVPLGNGTQYKRSDCNLITAKIL